MAIDAAGAVHVAVTGTGSDNQGIWYLTNATGRWVKQQVVAPWTSPDYEEPGRVDQPAIAIDPSDGSAWIAFAFWACADCIPNSTTGILYVSNAGGTWSAPVLLTGASAVFPSLAVRDGKIYLAWATGGDYLSRGQPWFGTDASGEWETQQVARAGVLPHLVLDHAGKVGFLFAASDIRYARRKASGDFVVERLSSIAGASTAWDYSALAVDPLSGNTWAAWNVPTDDQGHYDVNVATRHDRWSDPIVAVSGASLIGLGVHDGIVKLTADKLGLIYASNAGGAFGEQIIAASAAYWQTSAFALGPAGRPYVVITPEQGQRGIWFLEGPTG